MHRPKLVIANDDILLRRVHKDHWIVDNNVNPPAERVSSGAFNDPKLSVDSAKILAAEQYKLDFCLRNDPNHSLVGFTAIEARGLQQELDHDPLSDNYSHSLVLGKKSTSVKRSLQKTSVVYAIKGKIVRGNPFG